MAASPHGRASPPERQLCVDSGGSMPCRRTLMRRIARAARRRGLEPLADAMDAVHLSVDRFCLLAGVEALAEMMEEDARPCAGPDIAASATARRSRLATRPGVPSSPPSRARRNPSSTSDTPPAQPCATINGDKHVLAVVEGATENTARPGLDNLLAGARSDPAHGDDASVAVAVPQHLRPAHSTDRPPMRSRRARVAASPHGRASPGPERQFWTAAGLLDSGASMPCRRTAAGALSTEIGTSPTLSTRGTRVRAPRAAGISPRREPAPIPSFDSPDDRAQAALGSTVPTVPRPLVTLDCPFPAAPAASPLPNRPSGNPPRCWRRPAPPRP